MRSHADHTGAVLLAAGFGLWASAFTLLYAALSVGCELGWHSVAVGPLDMLRAILLFICALHLAVLIRVLALCRRRVTATATAVEDTPRFLARASTVATGAAIAATAWTAIPIIFASSCV